MLPPASNLPLNIREGARQGTDLTFSESPRMHEIRVRSLAILSALSNAKFAEKNRFRIGVVPVYRYQKSPAFTGICFDLQQDHIRRETGFF
jgi:hypothetical protein